MIALRLCEPIDSTASLCFAATKEFRPRPEGWRSNAADKSQPRMQMESIYFGLNIAAISKLVGSNTASRGRFRPVKGIVFA